MGRVLALRAGLRQRRGWSRDERLWWWLWSGCPGLGWARLQQLQGHCGSLAAAWQLDPQQLAALPGWGSGLVSQVMGHRDRWGERPLAAAADQMRQSGPLLLPGDPACPPAMLELERPPLALYWRGLGQLWPLLRRRQAIAVVGTRRPSLHGQSMAEAIGAALARAGWPVVSGLAEGIDAAAHRGCLSQAGRTVAVLGTPLERVYPRHHAALQQEVARHGLLVSEQPPGAAVRAGHFAARNRLQVALVRAVVVVECPESSGALHSARLAWEQQLPLYVVPADAGKRSALGSNRLLARGATPLIEPSDLIQLLGPGPLSRTPVAAPAPASGRLASGGGGSGSGRSVPGIATLGLPAAEGPAAAAATADALPAADPPARAPAAAASFFASSAHPPAGADPELLAAVGHGASLEQLSLALNQPPQVLTARLLAAELAGTLRAAPGLCWRPA